MSRPSTPAVKSFNFSKEVEDSIITFPVSLLTKSTPSSTSSSLPSTTENATSQEGKEEKGKEEEQTDDANAKAQKEREEHRERQREETRKMVAEGADSLVVVARYSPQKVVPRLVRSLKGGAAFAVFSVHPEPLAETHELLRAQGLAVNMALAETWLRVHQVYTLPSSFLSFYSNIYVCLCILVYTWLLGVAGANPPQHVDGWGLRVHPQRHPCDSH